MKKHFIFLSILTLIFTTFAQKQNNIAVLELVGKSISKEDASILTDKLRGELINSGKFQIIERTVMDQILKEQGFQQSGCTSDQCVVEIGQLIGVDKMVAGSIGKIENTYLISIRLISVSTGKIIKNVQKEITGSLTDVLKIGIPECAKKLAGISKKNTPTKKTVPVTKAPTKKEAIKKKKISIGIGYTLINGKISITTKNVNLVTRDTVNKTENYTLPINNVTASISMNYRKSHFVFELSRGSALWEDMRDETHQNFVRMESIAKGADFLWIFDIIDDKTFFVAIVNGLGYWHFKEQFNVPVVNKVIERKTNGYYLLSTRLGVGPLFVDAGFMFGESYQIKRLSCTVLRRKTSGLIRAGLNFNIK